MSLNSVHPSPFPFNSLCEHIHTIHTNTYIYIKTFLIIQCSFLFYFLPLQYYIDFAIYQHESTTGIHVFPILNPPPSSLLSPPSLYHPSGSSQCNSPKHPVSCIEPGLATHLIYDIIQVSMPFSQIIPPSPYPTVYNSQDMEAT